MLGSDRRQGFSPSRGPRRRRLLAFTGALAAAAVAATLLVVNTTGGSGERDERARLAAAGNESATGKTVGYFTNWGVYQRNYHVKDIETSGSADKLTHINYAFGNVQGGKCAVGDSYADYEKAYKAEQSVDGKADNWEQPLRGNFNQLLKLKKKHPDLKILWSFGGWTWSGGFGEAAKNPEAFAESCYNLVNDERWKGLFDGIDIDWEYPNACGLSCDKSGPDAFTKVMKAMRGKFGDKLVTAAVSADATKDGKMRASGYYKDAAQYVNWYLPMTYDYFGAFDREGPTAPHSPLEDYAGIPKKLFDTKSTIAALLFNGVPREKVLMGLGFYGRGWTGVTQKEPGGKATGPAPGKYEQGIEDYELLKKRCPANGKVAGTAYAHCGNEWWSYDTPETLGGKTDWAKKMKLGGTFVWELSGDTPEGELIKAIK
ncbi:glycoside hydrolase family 18 protein [Streptomyces albiaxialis]|uniref:chitinase n=1 Tax=Streptomyces albiaxialis TaxID=329523 RepID=A0ABN2VN98_9ACTN